VKSKAWKSGASAPRKAFTIKRASVPVIAFSVPRKMMPVKKVVKA